MPAGLEQGRGSEPRIIRIHSEKDPALLAAREAGLQVMEGRYAVHKYRGEQEPGNPNPNDLYEIVETAPNLFLTAGIRTVLRLAAGQAGTPFSGANARLCVGDSSTPAVAGQTDLQGTNKFRQIVDSAPVVTGNQILFVATFGTGSANFTAGWVEVGVANAASGGEMWSRTVPTGPAVIGPKTSEDAWILNWTLAIA